MGVVIFNNIMLVVFLGTIDEEYGARHAPCMMHDAPMMYKIYIVHNLILIIFNITMILRLI